MFAYLHRSYNIHVHNGKDKFHSTIETFREEVFAHF